MKSRPYTTNIESGSRFRTAFDRPTQHAKATIRKFETGATRDSDDGKNDYEGFLSPFAIEAFGDYMTRHRVQADGSLRDSDNWQKGIPKSQYVKSLFRHFVDLWKLHRGIPVVDKRTGQAVTTVEACCAILFNIQGYLHETLKGDADAVA
jgi:hypothetical protein